jgi:predicted  nucleic acid-binding Zn-ribbon protein
VSRTKSVLVIVGVAIAGYVGVNAFMIGGHLVRHREDRTALKALAAGLETEQSRITALEQELSNLERTLGDTERNSQRLREWIEDVEAQHPRGIPAGMYDEYTSVVDRYNGLIREYNQKAAQLQALQPQYAATVDSFNLQVERANALVRKIGDIPHLLPIDLPRRVSGEVTLPTR